MYIEYHMSEHGVFIEEELVTVDGAHATVGVTRDLQTIYDGRIQPFFTADSALCLAGLLKYPNKLLFSRDRVKAMIDIVNEHDVDISSSSIFSEAGKLVESADKVRKPAERDLYVKPPISGNVFSLGHVGAKQLVFVTNMGTIEGGLRIIDDEFGHDTREQNRYMTQFKKQYHEKELQAKKVSEQVTNFPQSTQKEPKTVKRNVRPSRTKIPQDDVEFYRQKSETESLTFTDPRIFLGEVLGLIEMLPNGEEVDFNAIVSLLRERDPNLMPGAAHVFYKEAARKGLVKKQNLVEPTKGTTTIYVRFNK